MVRSGPEVGDRTAIESFPQGTSFPYAGESGDWYQITLPSGEKAWVNRGFARIEVIEDPVRISGESVAVFSEPDPASSVTGNLESGRVLNRISARDGWVEIAFQRDRQGWVRGESLESLRAVSGAAEPAPMQADGIAGTAPGPEGEANPEATGEPAAPTKAEEAVRSFRYALEVNPKDGFAHFELAAQLEALGELDEALAHYRQAAELGERPDEALQRSAAITDQLGAVTEQAAAPGPASSAVAAPPEQSRTETGGEFWTDNSLLVGVVAACLFLAGTGLWFLRQRPAREVGRLLREGLGEEVPGGSPSGNEFLRQLKVAQGRQKEAGESIDRRFLELKKLLTPTSELGGEGDSEIQVRKIGELGEFIEAQQARINAFSDLLSLQNERISALEEELNLLRKLLPGKK